MFNWDTHIPSDGILGSLSPTTEPQWRGNAYKIAKFFSDVRKGEFSRSKPHPQAIGGTAESLTLGSTVRFDMDVISSLDQYMATTLINNKDEDGLHLADLGKLGTKNFNRTFEDKLKQSYITSIKRMLTDLDQMIDNPDLSPEVKEVAERHFNLIEGNISTLVRMHRDHLSDIGLNFEINYEDLAEDETARLDKNAASNLFNSMEFSTRETAPSIIKFLISTLPTGKRNHTLLQGSVDFATAMNFLQDKLAGTQSLEEQVLILKSHMNKKPWIKPLLKRLGVLDELSLENASIKDIIVQGAFFDQFAKQK